MSDPLSTFTAIIDTAKRLREVAKKVQDAEVRNLVADLNLQRADLKLDLVTSREELASAREEIAHLNEAIESGRVKVELRSKIERRGTLYNFKASRGVRRGAVLHSVLRRRWCIDPRHEVGEHGQGVGEAHVS